MNNRLLLLAAAAMLVLSFASLYKLGSWQETSLHSLDPVIDAGTVFQNTTVTKTFHVTNGSSDDIYIHDAYADCGCTTPTLQMRKVSPRESIPLDVSWNVGTSRDAAVSDIKLVYSKHGAKAKEYLDLRLTANVIPDFRFRPSELEFQYGIPSQRDVTIHPGRLNNVSLGDAYCTHRAFEVIVLPEKSAIRVNFNASEWHDDSTAELVVHVPGSTNQPKIAIPIQVTSEQE